jgi:hypothetical protein
MTSKGAILEMRAPCDWPERGPWAMLQSHEALISKTVLLKVLPTQRISRILLV